MATVICETLISANPDGVWDAVRDYGALHTRVAPGVVAETKVIPDAVPPLREVTFASGQVLLERIISVDDENRRLVWSIEDDGVKHHNGALQVHTINAGQSRVVWVADVLPDTLADAFRPLMEAGLSAMTVHLSE